MCISHNTSVLLPPRQPQVKVWYEPPPYGPGTALNRPSYGFGAHPPIAVRFVSMQHQAGGTQLIQQLSRRPSGLLIAGACVTFTALAYIPVMIREARQGLPFTLSPEYQAAQRAYMRYHNMNPIFGISSREARAADEAH
ncbi:predicted protein [Thalassiosira pseudonana CCMP1335]|uniref:Transmembrane protein n=1 Tax=Thalassiosira pseudonana TaxID=35128 RepID=B8LD93_THAPS|nr:predicted protein [Thalassiosira pseudonana CCMP1335]EED86673.1 predicted protein [Thalassiosira pseudonana CCMP1335]